MAIKRKGDNETPEQKTERLSKEAVANHATRSEKTAWSRKRLNLEKKVNKDIRPLEERIMDIQQQLRPLYDEISEMREEMVQSCIHPFDLLVFTDGVVVCKFCSKQMAVNVPAGE